MMFVNLRIGESYTWNEICYMEVFYVHEDSDDDF